MSLMNFIRKFLDIGFHDNNLISQSVRDPCLWVGWYWEVQRVEFGEGASTWSCLAWAAVPAQNPKGRTKAARTIYES